MHGQRRDEYKARLKDEATAAKLSQKALQWNALSAELLKRRRRERTTEDVDAKADVNVDADVDAETIGTLQLTEKLLTVNPDPIYLWNHRRELLLSLMGTIATDRDGGGDSNGDGPTSTSMFSPSDFIRQEQVLTQAALQRNPKAYGAWFHRKWSIRHYLHQMLNRSRSGDNDDINNDDYGREACIIICKAELILCGEFLMLDERNFHCWNYRRFVVGTLITLLQMSTSGSENKNKNGDGEPLHPHSHSFYIDGAWGIQMNMKGIPLIGAQLTKTTYVNTISDPTSFECNDYSASHVTSDYLYTEENQNLNPNPDIYMLLQSEFDFTSEKICQNFSNGSAFHYRSKLLPLIHHFDLSETEGEMTKTDRIEKELEIVRNAVFTEPDDQTSWWYFRFILSWARDNEHGQHSDSDSNEALEELKGLLFEEWESIEELVEAEDGKCKWGLLGLYMIASEFCEIDKEYEGNDWTQLKVSYVLQLKELDPDRSRRYDAMMMEED